MFSQGAYFLTDFVLPAGATSGQRIEFSGTTGVIRCYDQNDKLIATFAASAGTDLAGTPYPVGLTTFPPAPGVGSGAAAIQLDPVTGQIRFFAGPGQVPFTQDGTLYAGNPNGHDNVGGYLAIATPSGGGGQMQLWMRGPSKDGTSEGYYFFLEPLTEGDAAKWDAMALQTAGVHYGSTLVAGGMVARRQWQTLPLVAPWTAYTQTPQVRRSPQGLITVQGWAHGGTANVSSQVATLPADCRPGQRILAWVSQPDSTTVSNRAIIEPSGAITIDGGTGGSVSLNLPPFYAADVK